MIDATADGVLIAVRVVPRAGRSAVAGTRGDAVLVRLQAPPVDGAANQELVTVLASALGVPRRDVSIVAGDRSRQKRVRVSGLGVSDALARLGL
jgi:uncharacterized protein (TIGR00251 family)